MNDTNNFKLRLLKSLYNESNPYIDIWKLHSEYDIGSKDFLHTFQQLEQEKLIASDSNTNGLSIGCDGDVTWAVTNLYVTELGKTTLTPIKISKLKMTYETTKHPVISAVLAAIIILFITKVYNDASPSSIQTEPN